MATIASQPKSFTLNGEPHRSDAATVEALLEELKLHGRRVAVMVNDAIVKRAEFATRAIAEGDRVEVVSLIGGG